MCFECAKTNKRKQFVWAIVVSKKYLRNPSPKFVIATGFNSYLKTAPLCAKWAAKVGKPLKVHLHAESMAISRIRPEQMKKAYAIIVYRFDRNGKPALAKPCKVCEELIKNCTPIRHVYYTTKDSALDMDYERYCHYRNKYADQWCDEDCR